MSRLTGRTEGRFVATVTGSVREQNPPVVEAAVGDAAGNKPERNLEYGKMTVSYQAKQELNNYIPFRPNRKSHNWD